MNQNLKIEPYKSFLARFENKTTLPNYKHDLGKLDDFLKKRNKSPFDTTPQDLLDLIDQFKTKMNKGQTLRRKITILNSFYGYLYDVNIIKSNPAKVLGNVEIAKLSENKKGLSKEQRKELIGSLNFETLQDARTSFVILFGMQAGLRINEMPSLTWDNIDLSNKKLKLLSKGLKGQEIPISTLLTEKLKEFRNSTYYSPPYIFYSDKDKTKQNKYDNLRSWVVSANKWTKFENEKIFTTDTLYESFILSLLEEKLPIEYILKLARRESIQSIDAFVKNVKVEENQMDVLYRKVFD